MSVRYNRAVHDPTLHPAVPVLPDLERAATALGAGVPSGGVMVGGLDVGEPGPTPATMEPATTHTRAATSLQRAAVSSLPVAAMYVVQMVCSSWALRRGHRRLRSTSSLN